MQNNINFDDENNSIATILSKKKLRNNLYIFTFDKIEIGHLDINRGVFITKDGKEYKGINNPEFNKGTCSKVFATCLEKEDLDLVFSYNNNSNNKYLYNNYRDYVKSIMYLARTGKNKHGKECVYVQDVSLDKIEEALNNIGSFVVTNDKNFVDDVFISNERIEKFISKDAIDKLSISDDVGKLIMDVYNCEFNAKELFSIAENIFFLKDYLQCALETIELQLEAYYNGDKAPNFPDKSDYEFVNSDYEPHGDFLNDKYFDKKEEVPPEEVKDRLNLIEIRDEIKKYLVNQDEALRRVLVEIARMEVKENEKNKGILLLGESGTGKTYLMELLSKYLGVPFLIIDSTQLTIPGYVGKDIQEYLWDLYIKCDKDLEKAEHAIVFFDEIDKKGSNRKSDSSGQGVLNVLLKFLDGTTYDACMDTRHSTDIVKINTSKMKIIAGGAFSDVLNVKENKHKLGFSFDKEEENDKKELNIPDVDDFVQKAFMTPEFMGRFPIRIRLNSHSVDSFATILNESESSTLKEEERTFKKLGVKLSVTPQFVKLACSEALKLKTGVRGLMGTIEESTWVAFEDAYNNPGKYSEIILTEDTLKDPNNYQKVLKKEL